ncbi:flagellar hook-associated protein FlgK [Desulfovibrio inopinatus]|uniref:flagellar hook-associated protein FlgK n=1 Tax=Desulfovibrio inopinatus TaxID=102109 RepID=UPI0003FEE5DB|nr:flagellar hook-associated protein FlgK [Desulfovibrio inopinatus]
MSGITSLLNVGKQSLLANQTAIEVTGNNIANVNTEGYHLQRVHFEATTYMDISPGQIGTGVSASEVERLFDQFVEAQYNDQASAREMYNQLEEALKSIENLFNEANNSGISDMINQFFADWQDLSLDPSNYPKRQVVIEDAINLCSLFNMSEQNIRDVQEQVNGYIADDVDRLNEIVKQIADINQQITVQEVPGVVHPNGLYDQRDSLIRELAEIVDINVIEGSNTGDLKIYTKAGYTLVDGTVTFEMKYEGPKATENLIYRDPAFDGNINFTGEDEFEYTVKVVQSGGVTTDDTAAQFQVSLDGGKTWLKDDNGDTITFSARPYEQRVTVGSLEIYFGSESASQTAPTEDLIAGDVFTIVPKDGLYWYQSASTPINVTPQTYFSGEANDNRIVGGSLTGYFSFRDYYAGRYIDRLNALSESFTWEVNRIFSQGTGSDLFTETLGTYDMIHTDTPLGSYSTGLDFGSKLQSGASSFYAYSEDGTLLDGGYLDFSNINPPGTKLFDPDQHSLEDVVQAINDTFGDYVTASVLDQRLSVQADGTNSFAFGTDATGLYAALGVNTLFTGSTAQTMTINEKVSHDSDYLNTGHVNGAGEANQGDNTIARDMANLSTKTVTISTEFEGPTQQTLPDYYESLVGIIGVDTEQAEFNNNYTTALASDLDARQQSVSGVNLDEEMSNLIKFQNSYKAAAKLITTADQMFQTLLALKN